MPKDPHLKVLENIEKELKGLRKDFRDHLKQKKPESGFFFIDQPVSDDRLTPGSHGVKDATLHA